MIKLLKLVSQELKDGIEIYAAFIATIIALVINIAGGSTELLIGATSTILFFIAITLWRDKKRDDDVMSTLEEIRESTRQNNEQVENLPRVLGDMVSGRSTSSQAFFHKRGEEAQWRDYFRDTQQLDALGLSLAGLCVPHLGDLKHLRDSGGKIRLLVANPDNKFLSDVIAKRSYELASAEAQIQNVRNVIEQLKEVVGTTTNGGSLEVRTYDLIPSFAYLGTNTCNPEGKIYIEMYLTQVGLNSNPLFTLHAVTDNEWYTLFQQQFETFWDNGKDPIVTN